MVWHEEINEIKKRDTLSKKQGGEESVKKHHEKGRLTIRERIDGLLDSKTFDELGVGAGVPVFDDNNELIKFSKSLEEVCINTVESGSMTKDLAILIDKSTKYLTTNQFLEAIDSNLKKKLN